MAKQATIGRNEVTLRLPDDTLKQLDRWRREHGAKTRADAIQRLVEQALAPRAKRKARAARAAELASREVDRLADPSADAGEQTRRKRRLIKGPREFRSVRDDASE
jgi:hypothetical protein